MPRRGSYFTDGDRASGVFGVLATGFSVLLGFIIFLGFSSYDESRSGAEHEATIVAQQVQTAQFLPGDSAEELTGELSCYARSVAGTEWEAMGEGRLGDDVNPWGVADVQDHPAGGSANRDGAVCLRPVDGPDPRSRAGTDRSGARGRGDHPATALDVLFVISGVIFVYMLFFADPAEGAVTQGVLMGSVTVVIALLLLILMFFNHPPHGGGVGRLEPTAMDRTIKLIETQAEAAGIAVDPPCDGQGNER